jgi:hypothetical protein
MHLRAAEIVEALTPVSGSNTILTLCEDLFNNIDGQLYYCKQSLAEARRLLKRLLDSED